MIRLFALFLAFGVVMLALPWSATQFDRLAAAWSDKPAGELITPAANGAGDLLARADQAAENGRADYLPTGLVGYINAAPARVSATVAGVSDRAGAVVSKWKKEASEQ